MESNDSKPKISSKPIVDTTLPSGSEVESLILVTWGDGRRGVWGKDMRRDVGLCWARGGPQVWCETWGGVRGGAKGVVWGEVLGGVGWCGV